MDLTALLAAFSLDVISKKWAKKNVALGEVKTLPVRGVYFMRVVNKGFSRNVLGKRPELVKRGSAAALFVSLAYALMGLKNEARSVKLGYSLMLGGGLSNVCDRLFDDGVTDFICFGKPEKSGNATVFNLADFFIFIGAGIVFLMLFPHQNFEMRARWRRK